MKDALKFLRSINLSVKQAAIVLAASAVLFTALLLAFLNISTGTAAANRELDRQAQQDRDLTREINDLQTEIGKLTAADRMEQRVKDAGFVTPAKVEHLVVASDGLTTTATMTK
ncbi:MAG TPA: hypothetical protein PLJ62_01580 [Thermoflexales bacterium]|nr:hypothetical protein [Thermoflexales bacterium]HQW35238.1 hypothetical protein [Thermoflexales bacterium]HQX75858.1 hypothetical protein [Thermoflexales bacterium]HQZ20894.1 hypothetical protein [Thermoflexales bacterium]HQZ98865.1 hypothetical protein [Thermoflexales bacterium]